MKKTLLISIALTAMILFPGCGTMDQTSRTVVGSQIGSLAGGILGAAIGSSSDRWDGASLGAQLGSLAGGAAGAVIGANSANEPQQRRQQNIQSNEYSSYNDNNRPILEIQDIYLEDPNNDQTLCAGRSYRLSFIIVNNGLQTAINVKPHLEVEKGKSYFGISQPVVISRITSKDQICYSVNIRTSRDLPTGKAEFGIYLTEGNGFGLGKENFTINTRAY